MKDYLFYVRYCMSGLYVYHCKTDDPFHVMGEMHYRAFEHIERVTYVEQTDFRLDFWKNENVEIREWKNKYGKNAATNMLDSIDRYKEIFPDACVVLETSGGAGRVRLDDCNIYIGMKHELVFDAE